MCANEVFDQADERFPAERSVVLRYARAALGGELEVADVLATSAAEGLRLLDGPMYRGVRLLILDETTATATGTYKSLDGCITAAMCRRLGQRAIVFSSGANGGIALTRYGAAAGITTWFFCPASTLYKLDAEWFAYPGSPTAHLIAVEGSDRRVKQAAAEFAELMSLPLAPKLAWRLMSASCRGMFLAEHLAAGRRIDWFVQSVCAGFGPIGIYRTLGRLIESQHLSATSAPRLLGVQQAGLCPMVDAWRRSDRALARSADWSQQPLEPTLYNGHPAETYPMLCDILDRFGGDMMAVDAEAFARHAPTFAAMLGDVGIEMTRLEGSASPWLERAGLMAGAAALHAIDRGVIEPGAMLLVSVTGGAGPRPRCPAVPEFHIAAEADLSAAVAGYADRCRPALPQPVGGGAR